MAGPLEARVLAGVHVQQITGTGPLVPVGRLPRRPRRTRDSSPLEHFPDRLMTEAGRASDQPRPPAGLAAAVADRGLELGRELSRRTTPPARTIEQAGERRPRFSGRFQPAVAPAMRRRPRHPA